MLEDLARKVESHDKMLRGDPDNINEKPGVIAEQRLMAVEQKRTNEILMELRNAVMWIVGLVVSGFVTAVLALVYRGH